MEELRDVRFSSSARIKPGGNRPKNRESYDQSNSSKKGKSGR